LGNLLKAGVPLVEAIEVSLGTVPNYYLRDKLSPLVEQVKRGSSFSETLSELVKLPSVLKQLIRSGELSGNLGEMLLRSANYLQLEVELKLKNLTTLIEPATMLIVGITIGFIIYALLLPIVSISVIKTL
jgi:type II secretory pathway component PulF